MKCYVLYIKVIHPPIAYFYDYNSFLVQRTSRIANKHDSTNIYDIVSYLHSADGLVAEDIENIRQKYERHEGWLTPFSWCQGFHFQLSDIYTRLRLLSRGKKARGTATQKVVEMNEIFQPHEECEQPKKVLIEGNPGMGKTTYCNKIAYDWAAKKHKAEDCFTEFWVVLLLKCRDVEIESDLWGAIDDQLLPGEIQKEEAEKFFEFIRQNQSQVLLVLDGIDELPSSKLQEFTDIIRGKILPRCHLVVTARHEAGIPVRKVCDTLLEIEGFTEDDREEFIHKYFAHKENLAKRLLDKLEREERLKEMSTNPLNCALLCLLCEDFDGILPESRTQLFLEIVHCVLVRYRKKKDLPVDGEDLLELYKEQLKLLGSIALNGLREDKMYFEGKKLENQDEIPGFGFLSVQHGSSKRRPRLCYGFTHKSLQEFFAGYYLCCLLVSKEISAERVAADARYFRESRQVLLFTCGLLALRSEESVIALIKNIAKEVKDMEECLPVALECIKECKNESSDFHVELASTFGSCLKISKANLRKQQIDDAAVAVLGSALEKNSTVTDVNLFDNNLGSAGAEALVTALQKNTTLTNLDLSRNNLGSAGAESLAVALKTNTTLTNLDLSVNKIGPAGAESLAAMLKTNRSLTDLNLSSNDIGPVGAESLATALKTLNTSLTKLDLSNNKIGPVGSKSLAAALKTNTTLKDLNLSTNGLGPTAAKSLAVMLETNKTLRQLDLSYNDLDSISINLFAGALNVNRTITTLTLSKNSVSVSVREKLKEAHGNRIN